MNDVVNSSTSVVDSILFNLKIIALVEKGDKLSVTEESNLRIDNRLIRPIKRTLNNFIGSTICSRATTLLKIEEVINNAIKFVDEHLENEDDEDENDNHAHALNVVLAMNSATKGLENLKTTYYDDTTVESRLDIVLEKMRTTIAKLKK